jgi:spore coat polysaccharide biosynthesis protein SpsF
MTYNSIAILQARMSSSRLPGKVMSIINGKPIIYWQIKRILKSKFVDDLIVVTSIDPSDDVLVSYLASEGITVHRGSLNNVYSRFLEVVKKFRPKFIVRLTADCPITMPSLIDQVIYAGLTTNSDYLSNTLIPTFPDGLDVEFIMSKAIEELEKLALSDYEKEHVTVGIYKRADMFKVTNLESSEDLGFLRCTLDTEEDLKFFQFLFSKFIENEVNFDLNDVLKLRDQFPNEFITNVRTSPTFLTDGGTLLT